MIHQAFHPYNTLLEGQAGLDPMTWYDLWDSKNYIAIIYNLKLIINNDDHDMCSQVKKHVHVKKKMLCVIRTAHCSGVI